MSIVSLCAMGVVAAVLSLALRRESPETALLISLGSGCLILLAALRMILGSVQELSDLMAMSGMSGESILILLKVLGICFLTEFACDCAAEAGLNSLCGNLSLSGKLIVLLTAMPLLRQVLRIVGELLGG